MISFTNFKMPKLHYDSFTIHKHSWSQANFPIIFFLLRKLNILSNHLKSKCSWVSRRFQAWKRKNLFIRHFRMLGCFNSFRSSSNFLNFKSNFIHSRWREFIIDVHETKCELLHNISSYNFFLNLTLLLLP